MNSDLGLRDINQKLRETQQAAASGLEHMTYISHSMRKELVR
jgi:hypothetical protein